MYILNERGTPVLKQGVAVKRTRKTQVDCTNCPRLVLEEPSERNLRTLRLYRMAKATAFTEVELNDPLFRDHCRMVADIESELTEQRQRELNSMLGALASAGISNATSRLANQR